MPNTVFLSPHLDDAIYSCGGLMARLVGEDQSVTVLTVFAGDPTPGRLSEFAEKLHERWGLGDSPVARRREEDLEACSMVGAGALHIDIPEALYRRDADGELLYPVEKAVFGEVDPADEPLVEQLTEVFDEVSPGSAQVYSPLAIGGHVDHRIVRRAAERLDRPVWYYHDLPYAARELKPPKGFRSPGGASTVLPMEDEELAAWIEGIWAYESQRSTFWDDEDDVEYELRSYMGDHRGVPVIAPRARRQAG